MYARDLFNDITDKLLKIVENREEVIDKRIEKVLEEDIIKYSVNYAVAHIEDEEQAHAHVGRVVHGQVPQGAAGLPLQFAKKQAQARH